MPTTENRTPNPEPFDTMPAIRVIMMPKDTNALGTIFGGVILSYIDQAGAVRGTSDLSRPDRHRVDARGRLPCPGVRRRSGQLLHPDEAHRQHASVTVEVLVEAERGHPGGPKVKVTEAEVVFVHVGQDGRPLPIPRP
ncbi:MAG: acyl-CoA thioesterase [Thermoanaerobaculia bacterium]